MAFETVFDAGNATLFKFETVGQVIEGYYMGSFPFEGDYGPTKRHVWNTPAGAIAVIGQKNLIDVLPTIKPGTMMRVTYTGDLPPKKKGAHPMKLFKFQQDKTNTIIVDAVDFTPTDNFETVEAEEEAEAMDTAPVARATPPARPAQTPSPERQAAAQRLLNGRNKQTA